MTRSILLACVALSGCAADPAGPGAPDPGKGPAGGKADDTNEETGCAPSPLRSPAPSVLIAPEGYEEAVLAWLGAADRTLDVQMYQLERPSYVDALVAAEERGVAVRVLVHGAEEVNAAAWARLEEAGVAVREPPAGFPHYHPKVAVRDGEAALVMSGNWNESGATERNYAVTLDDRDDVADLVSVFETDWSGVPLDLACTRLVIAPLNARDRLLAHLQSATRRLDLSVMYCSDPAALRVVRERAAAGVAVRVLLADPTWITTNTQTAATLAAAGIPVRFYEVSRLHAKLIVADDVAFVGSENLSRTSLDQNREVGLLLAEPELVATLEAQLDHDWNVGTPPE